MVTSNSNHTICNPRYMFNTSARDIFSSECTSHSIWLDGWKHLKMTYLVIATPSIQNFIHKTQMRWIYVSQGTQTCVCATEGIITFLQPTIALNFTLSQLLVETNEEHSDICA